MARNTQLIQASLSSVFGVLTDIENYPSWMDGVSQIQVNNTDSKGRAEEVVMTLEGMGFRDTLTLAYQWGETHVSWHLKSATLVTKMHGTFQLEAQGDKTLVDYELDADVNVAIPGFMKQAGIANIVKATMQNLKARCER
ncbi:MAG: hypothetical protein RIS09_421 [Actinomycetota bacterium]